MSGGLTAGESDALLAAMDEATPGREARPAEIVRGLDAPLEQLAASLAQDADAASAAVVGHLLRWTRARLEIGQVTVTLDTVGRALAAFDRRSLVFLFDGGAGAIGVGKELARFVLEKRLGTNETVLESLFDLMRAEAAAVLKPISTLDLRLAAPFVVELCRAVCAKLAPTLAEVTVTPHRGGAMPAMDARVLCARFPVRVATGVDSEICIAIDPRCVQATPRTGEPDRRALERHAAAIEVEAVAIFGRAQMTLGGVVELEEGSVIRLDGSPGAPMEVRVGDVPVLSGEPLVRRGCLAIEVRSLASDVEKTTHG